MNPTTILVIEDEKAIRDMLRFSLISNQSDNGYEVFEAEKPSQAKSVLAKQLPDIILLDWMLPESSGVDFIHWLKAQSVYRDIPIILLTAKAEEYNKVKGLEAGADDYIVKPFSPKELVARIQAVLRRGVFRSPDDELKFQTLYINKQKKTVAIDSSPLALTKNEFLLLEFFVSHQGRAYSRQQLLDFVWGQLSELDERSVDAQIRRLRDKLKPRGYDHHLKTVRGFGYKWGNADE
jgi:two-component system phosphate regulon response regulator PhoB